MVQVKGIALEFPEEDRRLQQCRQKLFQSLASGGLL